MQDKEINRFRDSYNFLSNFSYSPILFRGLLYKTAEAAFQAQKTVNFAMQTMIAACKYPAEAKKFGRRVKLRKDWQRVKDNFMRDILALKFADRSLADRLLATGSAELIEGNDWGDDYWGYCFKTQQGKNMLGKILMETRQKLRAGKIKPIPPARKDRT